MIWIENGTIWDSKDVVWFLFVDVLLIFLWVKSSVLIFISGAESQIRPVPLGRSWKMLMGPPPIIHLKREMSTVNHPFLGIPKI